jgi:hypothetical protein
MKQTIRGSPHPDVKCAASLPYLLTRHNGSTPVQSARYLVSRRLNKLTTVYVEKRAFHMEPHVASQVFVSEVVKGRGNEET